MNKKCTPLKNVKLDETKTTQATFVITDEMKTAFHEVANETVEEYAKRIPEAKIARPNVTIQCDGTACKSVQDDARETKTDISTIKVNINSIDDSLKNISNNLDKRPCMKCVPKKLSGFYFRGHHIIADHIFGAFAWLVIILTLLTIDCCKQHSTAEKNMELAIRWHTAFVECNHKYEQLIYEIKDNLPKKKSDKSTSKRR